MNDTWKVWLPDWVMSDEIMIYDRWGQQVHQVSGNRLLEWDGTGPDGLFLPVGTYYAA